MRKFRRKVPTRRNKHTFPDGTRDRYERLAIEARKVGLPLLKIRAKRASTRLGRLRAIGKDRIEIDRVAVARVELAAIDFAVALLEAMGEVE